MVFFLLPLLCKQAGKPTGVDNYEIAPKNPMIPGGLWSVVIPTCQNADFVFKNLVDQAMLAINATYPTAFEFVFQ